MSTLSGANTNCVPASAFAALYKRTCTCQFQMQLVYLAPFALLARRAGSNDHVPDHPACRHADHTGCSISDCRAAALRQPAAMCSGSAVYLCPPRDCQKASMQSCIASAIAAVQRCGCAPDRMPLGRLRHIGCMMKGVRKSDVCDRDSATPLTIYRFSLCVDFIRNVAMHVAPCRGPEW